jgi:hypothetical protein
MVENATRLRIKCDECREVVGVVAGTARGWQLVADLYCDHVSRADVRRWFYTSRTDRAELRLPIGLSR